MAHSGSPGIHIRYARASCSESSGGIVLQQASLLRQILLLALRCRCHFLRQNISKRLNSHYACHLPHLHVVRGSNINKRPKSYLFVKGCNNECLCEYESAASARVSSIACKKSRNRWLMGHKRRNRKPSAMVPLPSGGDHIPRFSSVVTTPFQLIHIAANHWKPW